MFTKKDFQKLAGLWLAGEVVNHVGIYGSKAAEGLWAFQRWSCWQKAICSYKTDKYLLPCIVDLNTKMLDQNGCKLADNISKLITLNKEWYSSIRISPTFIMKVSDNRKWQLYIYI